MEKSMASDWTRDEDMLVTIPKRTFYKGNRLLDHSSFTFLIMPK